MATDSLSDSFDQLAAHFRQMLTELREGRFFGSPSTSCWLPRANVYESRQAFLACIELPGMPREKIEVHVEKDVLHIEGERPKPVLADHFSGPISVHQMEIDSGHFHRCITLPETVDAERISAVYRNGFLWIIIPRRLGD